MRYGILATSALAFVMMSSPSAVGAQAEVCGKVETSSCGGGEGAHKVLLQTPALSKGTHSDCRVCSGEFISDCHPTCPDQFAFGDMARAAFRSILESANEGDVGTILALSHEVHGAVVYNANRGAVQILDCSGTHVMASLRVRDQALRLIAAQTLPSALALKGTRHQAAGEF